jgi:molybdopterin converting factor subunit 1
MVLKVFMFGISKELFGMESLPVEINNADSISVDDLKSLLEKHQPALGNIGSYMIAINNEYATGAYMIHEKDEIAIIPPVSGG